MIYQIFARPLSSVDGIGPTLEKRFNARGVCCVGDLLLHLPKQYIDDSVIIPIAELHEGAQARVQGRIAHKQARGVGRKQQVTLRIADESGELTLNFFHAGYMMRDARLQEGREISVRGRVDSWHGRLQMTHPDWCLPEQFVPGLQPHYAMLADRKSKQLSRLIGKALTQLADGVGSVLDRPLAQQHQWPTLREALWRLHRPDRATPEELRAAQQRLKSEEIIIYLQLMREKRQRAECPAVALAEDCLSDALIASFPYPLTAAQATVWAEIGADLASGRRMHRLLQGDVAAGKTWLAALAMARAAGSGYQAALMAPTEVLAEQHAETLQALFAPLSIEVGLLTGSTRATARRELLSKLAAGELLLIVGTHALLSEDVHFANLALALVDEQHRFGVRQRWALADQSGAAVHLLAMTATPIPRTLALSLYGDMDLSVMRGMPVGRKPVETRVIGMQKMASLRAGMQRILAQNGLIYWIVPRIDEDESGASVEQRVALLTRYFPDAAVRGLHGRMKAQEKQAVLAAFARGACKILVSTTVVEVGVNVPAARLMVIEQAEGYGLSQLHQLRGRVGRSSDQGYCMLVVGEEASPTAAARLQQMVGCHDGLALAEADLALRGSGDAIGTRQHGDAGFRLLDVAEDAPLIQQWFAALPDVKVSDVMQRFWRPLADAVE